MIRYFFHPDFYLVTYRASWSVFLQFKSGKGETFGEVVKIIKQFVLTFGNTKLGKTLKLLLLPTDVSRTNLCRELRANDLIPWKRE